MQSNNTLSYKRVRGKTPSFSSILLDSIYRSIDDDSTDVVNHPNPNPIPSPITDHNHYYYTNHTKNDSNNYDKYNYAKQRRSKMRSDNSTLATVDLRHAIMIESWIDENKSQPHNHHDIRVVRQKSVPNHNHHNTTTSSTTTTTSTSSFSNKLRNNITPRAAESCFRFDHAPPHAPPYKIFTKTKSRAMKIYGELKKPKTSSPPPPPPPESSPPVSPGGKIAAFLNSIFRNSAGTSPAMRRRSSAAATTTTTTTTNMTSSSCSSASSFSRSSCLSSKTTSSKSKPKPRSVRFYPVSVIVDEDSKPCGHKSLQNDDINQGIIAYHKPKPSSSSSSKWRREKEIDALMMMIKRNCKERNNTRNVDDHDHHDDHDHDDEMMDDDDDDGESCASSDLFELENLSSIGVSRYSEELPVYGTTSLLNITA